jgi:hypothetical protein
MPSPALTVAVVALVVAMSGSAVAATTLLVHTKNIANGAVTGKKIANGAVGISKLARTVRTELAKAGEGHGTVSGPQGPGGPQGPQGPTGATGPAGAPGTSGVDSPLVYAFSGTTGPDSGTCGNDWATDVYDATYQVEPQVDGSYTIVKIVRGTFTTIAGDSPASCGAGNHDQVSGGRVGTFYGSETWTVASPGSSQSADFDPFARCGSACSPNTAGTSNSSDQAQNQAFLNAFFPSATAPQFDTNYDFVYTYGNQKWTDSNTPENNQGDITG